MEYSKNQSLFIDTLLENYNRLEWKRVKDELIAKNGDITISFINQKGEFLLCVANNKKGIDLSVKAGKDERLQDLFLVIWDEINRSEEDEKWADLYMTFVTSPLLDDNKE